MALKEKIKQTLDEMTDSELRSAWLVVKEIANQKSTFPVQIDRSELNEKIVKGLKQLDDGQGTELGVFLNEMEVKYGKK
jgi:hypothetical protein